MPISQSDLRYLINFFYTFDNEYSHEPCFSFDIIFILKDELYKINNLDKYKTISLTELLNQTSIENKKIFIAKIISNNESLSLKSIFFSDLFSDSPKKQMKNLYNIYYNINCTIKKNLENELQSDNQ